MVTNQSVQFEYKCLIEKESIAPTYAKGSPREAGIPSGKVGAIDSHNIYKSFIRLISYLYWS